MKRDPSGYWGMIGIKGDKPGHPFYGNQYTTGAGGAAEAEPAGVRGSVTWQPSHEMGERMLEKAKLGGFTVDIRTEQPVESGISVGAYPERSGKFDADRVSAGDISTWLESNRELLDSEPDKLKVGGWLETNGKGTIWLDVVRVYPESEKEAAIEMGKKKNQKCIADLAAIKRGDWNNAFIDTGGTGEAKAAKEQTQGTYMLFDANVTAEQIIAALMKRKK